MRSRGAPPEFGATVVLVGCYRPSVHAARALARRGRRVVVALSPENANWERSAGVEHSRAVSQTIHLPSWQSDPDAFIEALADESRRMGEPVVIFPMFEPVVILLSRNRDRLPPNAVLAAPGAGELETCIDKDLALQAAVSAGLPSAPHEVVRRYDDLLAAAARLGDVVIKPMAPGLRIDGRKAILCPTAADVARALPAWPAGHERLLVQRRIVGPRASLHFLARRGELLATVEAEVLRTDKIDGTGVGLQLRTQSVTPRVGELAARLVAELGYTGIGLAQFILDATTREAYFIELNPRPGALCVYAERAGVDLVNLGVDLASGLPVARLPPGRAGISVAWTTGELFMARRVLVNGRLSLATRLRWVAGGVASVLRADVHGTWSWRDPLPTLVTWARLLTRFTGRELTPRGVPRSRVDD